MRARRGWDTVRSFFFHEPGDGAIGPVPLHAGSQLRDVFRLGIVHLEQTAQPRMEWHSAASWLDFFSRSDIRFHMPHRPPIFLFEPGFSQDGRCFEPMHRREILLHLLAAVV